ncbi:hypothetical protein HK102_002105 [Quaeritorhiza haematococci]|nr:hypothetical protein HK102_002105 [Quaeritorhiza haematococci]
MTATDAPTTNAPGVELHPAKTILFALDESQPSVSALNWCFDYLLHDGDKLTVVAVEDKDTDKEGAIDRIKSLLRAVWGSKHANVKMGLRVLVGNNPGKMICELVESIQPEVLVLGSAGKSNLQGMMVGSVSQYCVAHAACPVIVARTMMKEEGYRGRLVEKSEVDKNKRRSQSPLWF